MSGDLDALEDPGDHLVAGDVLGLGLVAQEDPVAEDVGGDLLHVLGNDVAPSLEEGVVARRGVSAEWSPRIDDRGVVFTFPAGWVNRAVHPYAWHPCVVYYAPTREYLMANWGMGCDAQGNEWFQKPSYLGFWTAPKPWGPWRQVHEETAWTPCGDGNARAYQPQIAPKWIAADGSSFWLVWTDFQVIGDQRPYYSFNLQKVIVSMGNTQRRK